MKKINMFQLMHPDTRDLLKSWLELISEKGEKEAIKIIKNIKEY